MPLKEWTAEFQGHHIRVTNSWLGGAKLLIDGECRDTNTAMLALSSTRTLLSARIESSKPDSALVEVFVSGTLSVSVKICVNGQEIARDSPVKSWSTVLQEASFIAAIPLVYLPFAWYAAISSWGSRTFLEASIIFGLPFLAAAVVFVVAPVALCFSRTRRTALVSIVYATAYVSAMFCGLSIGERLRMHAFARLAQRSGALVGAIKAYEAKFGHPPGSLDALVPTFIAAIPPTGMRAYPSYEYAAGEKAKPFDENPWVLYVFTPSGGINFDQFMYFPRQNYPERGHGGWLERVGEWAYVHE